MTENEYRSAYFDDLELGQDWGSFTWAVTEEFCRGWQDVLGEETPDYAGIPDASEYAGSIAPPSLALHYLTECIQMLMPNRAQGGVHARQALTFGVPARVGDLLTTRMIVTNKYIKRERKYVEMTTETRNQRGELVVEGFRVTIWAA